MAAIAFAVLLGVALANSHAADFEEPLNLFSEASSLMHNAAKPVGVEFFCGLLRCLPESRGQSRVLTHFGKSEGFPRIRGSDLPCDEPGA
jgi:hypothetical protein